MENYFVFSRIYVEYHLTSNFPPAHRIPSQKLRTANLLQQLAEKVLEVSDTADSLKVREKIAQFNNPLKWLKQLESVWTHQRSY